MASDKREAPLPPPELAETPADFHRRMTVNLLGLIVVLLLLIAGFWLSYKLDEAKKAQNCLSAGHRNCMTSQRF